MGTRKTMLGKLGLKQRYEMMCKYNKGYFTEEEHKTAKIHLLDEERVNMTSEFVSLRNKISKLPIVENVYNPLTFPIQYVCPSSICNILIRRDIKTVADILRLTPTDMARVRGMGEVKLALLKKSVSRFIELFTGMDMPEGEWSNEPNIVEWEEGCYHMLVLRSWFSGNLCGYVGIPNGHPWHGVQRMAFGDVSCHGGITYAGDDIYLGKEGYWYLGFDCCHGGDLIPLFSEMPFMRAYCKYRNVEYVKVQVGWVMEQIRRAWGVN